MAQSTAIDKDNISNYYEFMSDEELNGNTLDFTTIHYVVDAFSDEDNRHRDTRGKLIRAGLGLSIKDFMQNKTNKLNNNGFKVGHSFFGVKDKLKPIDEYIAEIKESVKYNEY